MLWRTVSWYRVPQRGSKPRRASFGARDIQKVVDRESDGERSGAAAPGLLHSNALRQRRDSTNHTPATIKTYRLLAARRSAASSPCEACSRISSGRRLNLNLAN